MEETFSMAVGDLVVRYGKILKVFRIKKGTIGLQPFFHLQTSNGLTFTLMTAHAHDGHIRRLASKAKIEKLLNLIIKKPTTKNIDPDFDPKTALSDNKLAKTLFVIKTLWLEKQEKSGILPGTKSTVFRQAMIQATEEIAAVNQTSPEQVKLLILSGLKFSQKENLQKKKKLA